MVVSTMPGHNYLPNILTFLTKKLIPPYSITISPQQTPHDPHIPFGSTQPSPPQTHPLPF